MIIVAKGKEQSERQTCFAPGTTRNRGPREVILHGVEYRKVCLCCA